MITNLDKHVLILPGDGANGGTVFTDWSISGKTITPSGSVTTSTTKSKYYGSSILLAGGKLSVADNADFNLGAGDFTIGFWGADIVGASGIIMGQAANLGAGSASWAIYTNTGSPNIGFVASTGGGSWNIVNLSVAVSTNHSAFKYYEFNKSGGTLTLYIDGTSVGSAACGTMPDAAYPLIVGMDNTGTNIATGSINDLFIIKGAALHSTNFTPPTRMIGETSGNVLDSTGNPISVTIGIVPVDYPSKIYTGTSNAGSGNYLIRSPSMASVSFALNNESPLKDDLIYRTTPL